MFKEIVRALMYPFAVAAGGEFYAEEGTLRYRFLTWLYGEPAEVYSDCWNYPECPPPSPSSKS